MLADLAARAVEEWPLLAVVVLIAAGFVYAERWAKRHQRPRVRVVWHQGKWCMELGDANHAAAADHAARLAALDVRRDHEPVSAGGRG